jgi:hypothetical protein
MPSAYLTGFKTYYAFPSGSPWKPGDTLGWRVDIARNDLIDAAVLVGCHAIGTPGFASISVTETTIQSFNSVPSRVWFTTVNTGPEGGEIRHVEFVYGLVHMPD